MKTDRPVYDKCIEVDLSKCGPVSYSVLENFFWVNQRFPTVKGTVD